MTVAMDRRALLGAAAIGTAAAMTGNRAFAAEAEKPVFGPAPGVALLSRNENPYGPAPSAIRAMADSAALGCYYANGGTDRLTAMIAERFGVGGDQVVIGSGSTEVLNAAIMAYMHKGAVLAPELFWDTTVRFGVRKGATLKSVPLATDMSVDLDALAATHGPDIGMIHLCNPNNPTGMVLDGDMLRAFVRKLSPQTIVIVDEAYNELTDRPDYSSVAGLVKECPNLIVFRTFSKIYGMAGLRLGYAITSPEHAANIRGYLMNGGLNAAGLAAAIASYNDTAFLTFSKQKIVEARGIIMDAVKKAGLMALPSQTNFLFVKVADANAVQKAMASQKIMIRGAYGKWTQWSRVSTGRIEDVKRYAMALPQVVNA
jgi:histidinol-phosphate aminotransferase